MKKILHVNNPFLHSFPKNDVLSCICDIHPKLKLWLFNNCMNMYYNGDIIDFSGQVFFYNNIFFETQKLMRDIIKKLDIDIVNIMKLYLDENYYIYLYLNNKHIKCSVNYNSQDRLHDKFIYGYDDDKQVFLVGDYFDFKHFSFNEVKYDEISKAYYDIPENLYDLFNSMGINFFRLNQNSLFDLDAYKLDFNSIKFHLNDYITNKNKIFGVNTYDIIKSHITETKRLDSRGVSIHKDHNRVVIMFMEYLRDTFNLYDEETYLDFNNNSNKLEYLKFLFLKYNLTLNCSILEKIRNTIDEIIYNEKLLFNKLIAFLKNGEKRISSDLIYK